MEERRNAPKLRFPGFTDPWEQRRFGELALLRRGLTYTPDDVVDAQQGTRVLRSSNINEDRFELSNDDDFVREDAVNIDLVRNNDILITAANGSSRLVGKRALIKGLTDSAVHGGFMLLASTEEPDFFNAVMGTEWYRRFLRMGVAGGNGALGNLDSNALRNRDLLVPKRAEQKAIGVLFAKLDSLIALHQRELDHVKELKKGLLQKMFPKEGANVPELRFPGFTDPWEQRKLGDVATIVGGGTPSTNNDAYWDGEIDWYSPAELGERVYADRSVRRITQAGYDSCSATLLPAGKTILFTSRAGIGNTAILRRSACTNQGFQSLVVNDDIDVYFVYSMTDRIKKFAEQKASGSTFLEISGKGLAAGEFAFPSKDEQTAIGSMFKQLDNLITLHQRELDHVKELKKGLLQQMFV